MFQNLSFHRRSITIVYTIVYIDAFHVFREGEYSQSGCFQRVCWLDMLSLNFWSFSKGGCLLIFRLLYFLQ